MSTRHMIRAHVLLPLGVLAVLLVAGLPFGRAAGYAMAAGCASMVLMMFGPGHAHGHAHGDAHGQEHDHAHDHEHREPHPRPDPGT